MNRGRERLTRLGYLVAGVYPTGYQMRQVMPYVIHGSLQGCRFQGCLRLFSTA